jgi:hypothetical protein
MDVLAQGGEVSADRIVAIVGAAATVVCAVVAIMQYRYSKSSSGSRPVSGHSSGAAEIQALGYGFLIPLFAGMIMSSTAFLVSAFISIPPGTFVSWFIFGLLSLYSFIVLIGLGFSFISSGIYEELHPYKTGLYFAGLALAVAFLILNLYFAGAF